MIPVKALSKGLDLSTPIIIAGGVGGLSIILTVGLLSGLVARPNNCIPPTTLEPNTTFEFTSSSSSTTFFPEPTSSIQSSSETTDQPRSTTMTSSSSSSLPQTTGSPTATQTTTLSSTSSTVETSSSTSTKPTESQTTTPTISSTQSTSAGQTTTDRSETTSSSSTTLQTTTESQTPTTSFRTLSISSSQSSSTIEDRTTTSSPSDSTSPMSSTISMSTDSTTTGSTDSTSPGSTDSTSTGTTDSTSTGSTDSTSTGSTDSTSTGSTDSTTESSTDSTSPGSTDSTTESSTDSTSPGSTDSTTESSTDSTSTGTTDSTSTGTTDSTSPGSTDSTTESSTDSTSTGSSDSSTSITLSSTSDSSSDSTSTDTTRSSTGSSTTTSLTPRSRTTFFTLPSESTSTSPATTTTTEKFDLRLPNLVQTKNYKLTISAFFDPYDNLNKKKTDTTKENKESFLGTVEIKFTLKTRTNKIVLHIDKSLTVDVAILKDDSDNEINIADKTYLPNQFYEIDLTEEIDPGDYTLEIDYEGDFGPITNLNGFYRSRYTEDGVLKTVASTNFEPTDARKAFPCFDEPNYKATFDIIIEHPAKSIAISNWPVVDEGTEELESGRLITKFQTTFPMSTYLAAWTIAPDDWESKSVNLNNPDNTKISVFSRKSAIDAGLADFSLVVAKGVTEFFLNVYFNITEAIPPKIDMVALPDFPGGAMEHWGMITFRESALLYSDEFNSATNKQRVAFIVAHELAHFWFGNLVTCAWWDELWLNEAMATFLEYKAISNVFPDWDVNDQFVSDVVLPVLYDDGYPTSQTVAAELTDASQFATLFSSIVYNKGGSILTMLEDIVGKENFQDGLRNYINENRFSVGVATEFYNKLQLPSDMGTTVEKFMNNWLLQINYPNVEVDLDNSGETTVVKFNQSRFTLNTLDENDENPIQSPFNYTWKIYLKCKVGKKIDLIEQEFTYYLEDEEGQKLLDQKFEWIKCNKDFKGHYVTNYQESNFIAVTEVLRDVNRLEDLSKQTFSIGDRANLIHNAFTMAYKGLQSYEIPDYLTSYMDYEEKQYVPWKVFTWHINRLVLLLEHRTPFIELKDFGVQVAKQLSIDIDIWNDDPNEQQTKRLLKATLIDFLCRLQDSDCLVTASKLYDEIPLEYFVSPTDPTNTNQVPGNYRTSVYKYHTQNTYEYEDWFRLNNLYSATIDPQERSNVLTGLAAARPLWIIDQYLYELVNDETAIKPQDLGDVLTQVGRNPTARHRAWYFIREESFNLARKLGLSRVIRAVKSIAESFDTVFLLEELIQYFDSIQPGVGELNKKQALEIVNNNIFWVNQREQELIEVFFRPFFKKN